MEFMKPRDVLAGYYGYGNFGDDLFSDVLVKALQSRPWGAPQVSQHTNSRFAKIRRHVREAGNLARARSVTLGGGSILGARPPASIRNIEMATTRLKKIPYCAIGVGVLEGLADLPHELIRHMSWVGLRSERDYAALRAVHAQIRYTSDLAYAADARGKSLPRNEVAVIPSGVGELGRRSLNQQYILEWLTGNIRPLTADGGILKVMALQPTYANEVQLSKLWADTAASIGIPAEIFVHRNAQTTLEEIASSRFVFTDRLHGAIASHLCGVPFRLSRHHPKCIDLLSDLKHPDSGASLAFSDDLNGEGISLVEQWSGRQSHEVARHIDLAKSGIDSWLDHLEERLL